MTETSVKVSRFSLAGKLSTEPMMLWGQGPDGKTVTAFIERNSSETSIEVPRGFWSFYVIMWSGPNYMEGTASCGTTSKDLTASEEAVELSIKPADCGLAQFSAPSNVDASKNFIPLKLIKCDAAVSGKVSGSTCDANMGSSSSFRFVLSSRNKDARPTDGMYTQCHNTFADSVATTAFRLPVTASNDSFATLIQLFPTSDCSGVAHKNLNLPTGLGSATGDVAVRTAGGYTEVFVTDVGTGATPTPTPVPAPTVTSISPASGPAAGGTTITITGTGFAASATVTVGGTACTSSSITNATTYTCVTPAKTAGAYAVAVANLDGQSGSLASAFTAVAAPTVTSISPTGGPLAGGTSITITGTGFVGSLVTIGGSTCTSPSVTSTSITCTSPALSGGTHSIVVTNSDSQTGTLASAFTAAAAPTISGVSAATGPLAGGVSLVITGTGFANTAVAKVGSTNCSSTTYTSATSVTCTTPALAAATYSVSVTNPDGQVGTLASAHQVLAAPTITNVNSATSNGAYGVGTTIPVTVTFSSNVVVTTGGGTPTIRLATGAGGSTVTYTSGSGTPTLTFNYTITATHNSTDLDYFSTSALELNLGTIKDTVGNDAILTLPTPGAAGSLGANKAIVVDTTAPTAVTVSNISGVYGNSFSPTFSGSTDASGVTYYHTLDGTSPTCASTSGSTATIPTAANAVVKTLKVISCDGAGNMSSVVTRTYTSAVPTIVTAYTNATNWNQYVMDKSNPNSAVCDGGATSDCYHGGAVKKVVFSMLSSCAGLALADNLGVFAWRCEDNSGAGPVTYYNDRFNTGKRLADLLNTTSWKPVSVTLTGTGVASTISSNPTTLWTNPVSALPSSSASMATLTSTGGIYTYSANESSQGIRIGVSGVAIVNLNSSPAVISTSGASNCNSTDVVTTANGLCQIAAANVNYLWLENISLNGPNTSSGYGLLLYGVRHSNFANLVIARNFVGLKTNSVHRSTFGKIISDMAGNTGVLFQSSNKNLLSHIDVAYAGSIGLDVVASNANRFFSTRVFNTVGSYGVEVDSSIDNTFSGLTVTNNNANLYLFASSNNVFQDVTLANSVSQGLFAQTNSNNNTFNRLVATNNSDGIWTNASHNQFVDVAVSHNTTNGIQLDYDSVAQSTFRGSLLVGYNGSNCVTNNAADGLNGSCGAANLSTHTLYTGKDVTNSFIGKTATTDSHTTMTSFMVSITNTLQAWGNDGSTFPEFWNRDACSGGTCRLWDWRLAGGDTVLRGALASPAASDTITHTWSDTSTVTFLSRVREFHPGEVTFAIGNGNGLCEANEKCLKTSNVASDQGSGTPSSWGNIVTGTVAPAYIYHFP